MTILVVHIEQINGMTNRVPIEHTFLNEYRGQSAGIRVNYGGSDAATSALSTKDYRINSYFLDNLVKFGSEENTGPTLSYQSITRQIVKFWVDVIIRFGNILPLPLGGVCTRRVRLPVSGGEDYRQLKLAKKTDQHLRRLYRFMRVLTTP